MTNVSQSRAGAKTPDESGEWVGRGAKRFDNQGEWAGIYAMMGITTFVITGVFFLFAARLLLQYGSDWWNGTYPILLLAAQQLFLLVYAIALSYTFRVSIGENGMEVRTLGLGVKQFAWSQIVQVELYRMLGMRCVRVFLVGKRSPVYLPLYLKQTDSFFGEVAQWLGRKPVPETAVQSPLVSHSLQVSVLAETHSEPPLQQIRHG